MTENEISRIIVTAAIEVHRKLGPGLLERVYEACLAHELKLKGLSVERQVPVQISYKDIVFDEGFRADLLVEGKVVLELKSVEEISRAHRKQIQTYLSLMDKRLGFLLNFGAALMKEGLVRAVNNLEDESQSTASGFV